MLSLNRRGFLLGCCAAGGLCGAPKRATAQQSSGFQCLTIEPPLQSGEDSLQPYVVQNHRAPLIPFTAQRLESEFHFTPFGVASAEDRWRPQDGLTPSFKVTLGVHFLNGTSDQREHCIRAASDWLRGGVEAYLDFAWNQSPANAQIRVRFGGGGNWSQVGRNALSSTDLTKPTMNIADLEDYIIKHEFGHALGLRHEHQHPSGGIQWKEEVVIAAMTKQKPPWTAEQTKANIFARFDQDTRCIGDPFPTVGTHNQ